MKSNFDVKQFLKKYLLQIFFSIMIIFGLMFTKEQPLTILTSLSNMMIAFLLITIALIIPIKAGLGFNFGIIIGTIAGQSSVIFIVNFGFKSILGIILAILLASVFSLILGFITGFILAKADKYAMISSYFLGASCRVFYQFVFFVLAGSIIPLSSELLFSDGKGIRQSISLSNIFSSTNELPFLIIIIAIIVLVHFLLKSKFIKQWIKNTTTSTEKITAVIVSTFLAALGQILFIYHSDYIFTSNPSMNAWHFGIIALIIGGATYKEANIKNALIGTFLSISYSVITLPVLRVLITSQIIEPINYTFFNIILISAFIFREKHPVDEKKIFVLNNTTT